MDTFDLLQFLLQFRSIANKDIYNRLLESQYEVTDSFSYYLTVRKPDHQAGVHILIPQNGFYSNSVSLDKLQKVSLSFWFIKTIFIFFKTKKMDIWKFQFFFAKIMNKTIFIFWNLVNNYSWVSWFNWVFWEVWMKLRDNLKYYHYEWDVYNLFFIWRC